MSGKKRSKFDEKYPKEVWELIVDYARKYSELSDTPLLEAIREKTPIYFFIGNYQWDYDPNSEYSKEFEKRIDDGEEISDVAYQMHIKNYRKLRSEDEWFGCFRSKFAEDRKTGEKFIKLHFRNADETGYGPLAKENFKLRFSELREMLEEVKKEKPETEYVRGGSWLYHYDSYKRLFPQTYTREMQSISPQTHYMIIWGQFINSEKNMNEDIVAHFYHNLNEAVGIDDLNKCFKYTELHPKGRIEDFYKFYGID